jgi:RNA polymerase sigma factor (sigma-70 family)
MSPERRPDEASPSSSAPLLRVARGEAASFGECVARYGGLVWSMARRLVPSEAEDAVQEVFVDLWKSAPRFDPAIASDVTFVAMIARRRLIDRRRKVGRRPERSGGDDLPEIPSVAPGPDRGAEAAMAAKAVDQLAPDARKVVLLATCHGMSHEEIAEALGMPLGTVKSHARRGVRQIRATLLGVEVEEDPS